MKLRPGALLVLLLLEICSPGLAQTAATIRSDEASTPPIRVRWILDIKKKLGYEGFDRSQSENSAWKSQQGIAFLSADQVALYQLNRADASSGYSLQVEVLDAKDGHEIKNLRLPANSELAKLMPTHGGGFLLHTGDEVQLYSSKFELVATRKLPGSKDDWQVDVSPSGAQIILAHEQTSQDAKGKETDSKTDVEVLDSATLKRVQAFTVPDLNEWSAADNAIVTRNPEDEEGDYGIMDFNGKWRALKTSAGSGDPGCPYRMEALEHQLLTAHDCDDLVVITTTGREKFSQAIRADYVLTSVAGADHYLAAAVVEPQNSHAYIIIYDLATKAQVSWLSLEKKTIYFSISPTGAVATVDGDRLKLFEPAVTQVAKNPQQRWSIDLEEKYDFESFDRDTSPLWMRQQDVRFITPEEVAVYQVRRSQQAASVDRDASGGGGNFYLQLEIFSARDGHEIKSMRLPTNAQFSKVIPTRDGKFLVRTGDALNLYSANFEQLALRPLPLGKIEGAEGWQIDVSPIGDEIMLAHQQRFASKSLLVGEKSPADKDHADVEVVDADTLQPLKKFTVKSLRDNWSADEHSLVAASPDQANRAFGRLDFDGKWTEIKSPWTSPLSVCPGQMQALSQDRVAVVGCRFFGVVGNAGEKVLEIALDPLEVSMATNGAGPFVAVEVDRVQAGKPISASKPQRVEAYDLTTKSKVITVPLSSDNPYFDISSQGELAVVEGDHLSLYFPNRPDGAASSVK